MSFAALRRNLTVKRPAGSYVDGVWQEATTAVAIAASVQPLSAEELETLPEARRQSGSFKLYSSQRFQTVQEGVTNPDIVVIDGQDYEVLSCSPWQNGLINHYKTIVSRVQPT